MIAKDRRFRVWGVFSLMDPVVTAPRGWDISHGEILLFHSVGLRFWGLGFAV